MAKIAFFELGKQEEDYIKDKLKRHKLLCIDKELNLKNVNKIKDFDIIAIFINQKINAHILNKLPKLRFITTMSTGFDHINLKECKKRKIIVSNVPYYGENTVAEHTMALILALSRKLPDAIERTRKNDFSLKGLMGFDLKGKTLGVIGAGHIGQHVIKRAKAFEMNIIAYDPYGDKKLCKKLGFKYVSLEYLLKNSDITTIHAPLTKSTYYMINMKNIKLIKKGAYLINTARGAIVDTKALIYALEKNILKGAALDVLEGECELKEEKQLLNKKFIKKCDWEALIRNYLLLKNKNVIVTPHSAFYSKEALQRILDTTIENIKGFLKGKPKNRI